MEIDRRFKNRLKARYERHDIRAGILKDRQHRKARSRFTKAGKVKKVGASTTVEGMKARRMGKASDVSVSQISVYMRKSTGINIYTAPFKGKPTREAKKFIRAFMLFVTAKTAKAAMRRRAEDLLVEAIRSPIKRKKYGRHSRRWAFVKGFQRRFFDTGQLYTSIRGTIRRIARVGGKAGGSV